MKSNSEDDPVARVVLTPSDEYDLYTQFSRIKDLVPDDDLPPPRSVSPTIRAIPGIPARLNLNRPKATEWLLGIKKSKNT